MTSSRLAFWSSSSVALILLTIGCAIVPAAAVVQRTGNRVMNCHEEAKSLENDCDAEAYIYRAAMYLAVPLVIGSLIMISCPFYFCFRFCFNCCGGRMPSKGCCCACGESEPVYSLGERFRPKVYVTVLLVLAIIAAPWSLAGAAGLTSGLLGFADDLRAIPASIDVVLNRLEGTLTTYKYNKASDVIEVVNLYEGSLENAGLKVRNDLDTLIQDSLGSFNEYVETASQIMFVVAILPFICVVIGTICGWLNIRHCIPTLLLIIMYLLFTPSVWIMHGIAGFGSVLFGDICAEVHGIATDQRNVLTALMDCKESMFDAFTTTFVTIEGTQSSAACLLIRAACYDATKTAQVNADAGKPFNCPSPVVCSSSDDFSKILTSMEAMTIHANILALPTVVTAGLTCVRTDGTVKTCNVDECTDACKLPDGTRSETGKVARGIKIHTDASGAVAASRDTVADSFASCTSITRLILGPFDPNCKAITTNFMTLHNSFGLSAITTVAFLFVMVWGSKRFVSGLANAENAGVAPAPEAAQDDGNADEDGQPVKQNV